MGRHEELRKEIDQIDRELVQLVEKRMKVSTEIAEYKLANNIPVLDAQREKKVINKNISYLTDRTLDSYISEFSKHLMELSRRRQKECLKQYTKTC
ncbi:chorismate mutase [Jeotgalicoccus halotolerans]|uniref:Chorismate mutase n=1 Tax=Jeotgalicoccus halotolerans TaxID=157227 RepID=A0A3E0AYE6_9STAP|nr:chorismate mutase [Jeotgalicoccus halotolerans]REG24735.1 chorismate mutase [Jeotgalicoccus halotolerans]